MWLEANIALAMEREDLADPLRKWLTGLFHPNRAAE